ncbi:hypothetical protein SBOR_7552 [Sclerotinia borealis F-4128]|uniref:Mid2 domain-containing protein n=1 Tax=Sclerotinia borealis (strain F-4128) TaxID=1432307 RepID=W9C5L7_SCLBF|nr:hypothetical protein SBOR_7552 [Sclerotinia borealis F-4128]
MFIRQISAVATALLVQVSAVLSSDVMQNRTRVWHQEQGHAQQAQGQEGQNQQSSIQSLTTGGQGQQTQAQQSQASPNRRQQSRYTNAVGSEQCFLSNGNNDPNGIPCFSGDNTSRCCGANEFCSTNKLCVSKNDPNKFSRGSCVDPTFQAASCPNVCQSGEFSETLNTMSRKGKQLLIHNLAKDTGAVLPCGDPSLGQYCCDEGQGFACCSTPRKVLRLGKGTTFTENSFNPDATSDSNSQSQRPSQSETTNTNTAITTRVQTQTSSATQTVVKTSVSVSIQIVTSTQSPTPSAMVFSPVGSATASTFMILVTQTTTPQNQPSNSLEATRSASEFQNQNSQPLPFSTFPGLITYTQASSASSSPSENQNQNGQTTTATSTIDSQNSSKAQSQAEIQTTQSSSSTLPKTANIPIILVGVGVFVLILVLGIAIFCIRRRKRGRDAKTRAQSQDGTRQASESENGMGENMGKRDEMGDKSIGVFITVSEKFRGLKQKAHNVHVKKDDRVSREFDGALGGGIYLEGGTMGRGGSFISGGGAGPGERRNEYLGHAGDRRPRNPPSVLSGFNNPRTAPARPPPPLLPQQSREPQTSQNSFASVRSESGSESERANKMFSHEEERGLGLGLGLERVDSVVLDAQRQEQRRGFF